VIILDMSPVGSFAAYTQFSAREYYFWFVLSRCKLMTAPMSVIRGKEVSLRLENRSNTRIVTVGDDHESAFVTTPHCRPLSG
jgi:hypothetical protein